MKDRNDREELEALNRGLNAYLAAKAGKELPPDEEGEGRSERSRRLRRGSLNSIERRKSPLQPLLTVLAVAAILALIAAVIYLFLIH